MTVSVGESTCQTSFVGGGVGFDPALNEAALVKMADGNENKNEKNTTRMKEKNWEGNCELGKSASLCLGL
jgi:hypothetical protein